MAVQKSVYSIHPTFTLLSARLWQLYKIDLGKHIDTMLYVGDSLLEGVRFIPVDYNKLELALISTQAFSPDDRNDFFGNAASMATKGQGYREEQPGGESLHFAIAPGECSVHIDEAGFCWEDSAGDSHYSPDAPQHIIGELVYPELVKLLVGRDNIVGRFLRRSIHPMLPSSQDMLRPGVEPYHPGFGVRVDLWSKKDPLLATDKVKLTFDLTRTCLDRSCHGGDTVDYAGLKLDIRWGGPKRRPRPRIETTDSSD